MPQERVPSPGEVIRERFLEPNGITPYRLAKALGKPQATLSKVLKGKSNVTIETAASLAKALGTTPEYWVMVDARYQLSMLDDKTDDIEVLIKREEDDMHEDGGWVFSDVESSDTRLGAAMRSTLMAAVYIDHPEREMLLKSVNTYVMDGIVSFPGTEDYVEYREDIPDNAIALFTQFLITIGEDPQEVKALARGARDSMYQEVGTTDIDGFERPGNWRGAKSVAITFVGELMCAVDRMPQESRDEVMKCLSAYAHDSEIVFPENHDAFVAFNRFLWRCGEGFDKLADLTGLDTREYGEVVFHRDEDDA